MLGQPEFLDIIDPAHYKQGRVLTWKKTVSGYVLQGTIYGHAQFHYMGASVALNDAGTVMIVGAVVEDETHNPYIIRDQDGNVHVPSMMYPGKVHVYDWQSTDSVWVERSTMPGFSSTENTDNLGAGVAMSASGSTIAVGVAGQQKVRSYDYIDNAWVARPDLLRNSSSGCFTVTTSANDLCTNPPGQVDSEAECLAYFNNLKESGVGVNPSGMDVFSSPVVPFGCTQTTDGGGTPHPATAKKRASRWRGAMQGIHV